MLTVASLEKPLVVGWHHGRLTQRFMRTRNAKLPIALFVTVGAVKGLGWPELGLGSLLLGLVYGFVVIFNDINDAESDRLNHRDLPLATGQIGTAAASWMLVGLAALILCLVLAWGSTAAATAAAVATAAGYAYSDSSLKISGRGLAGPTLLALCYVGTPILFVLTLTDGSYRQALPVTAVAALFAMATSLYKDYGDETGDLAVGKLTPLVRYGTERVARLALLVQGIAVILGSVWLGVNWWLLPATAAFCVAAWIGSRWRDTAVVLHRYLTTASICMLAAGALG